MAKARSVYSCTECGGESPKWQGQCPHCGAWNTLVEGLAESAPRHRFSGVTKSSELKRLADVNARDAPRMASGMDELDRVLGGGFVAGEVVLIGGDPGVGKSTLLLQVLARISGAHKAVYVSGEESIRGSSSCSPRSSSSASSPPWKKPGRKSPSSTRFKRSTRSSSPPLPARSRRCASAWRT